MQESSAQPQPATAGSLPLRPLAFLFMALLLAAGLYARVAGVAEYHYNPDETRYAQAFATGELKQVLELAAEDGQPPLGPLVYYGWSQLSQEPHVLRGLSLLFGISLIGIYYLIGARLGGPLIGLCAAAFVTFSRGCIEQSYLLRFHALFVCLLSLGYLFYLYWQASARKRHLLACTLCVSLACLTQPAGLLFALVLAGLGIGQVKDKTQRRRWALAAGFVLLVGAAMGLLWLRQWPWLYDIDQQVKTIINSFSGFLWISAYLAPTEGEGLILGFLLPFIFLIGDARLRPPLYALCACFLLHYLLSATQFYTFFASRRELWLLPFFVPVLAWGASALLLYIQDWFVTGRQQGKHILTCAFLFVFGLASDTANTKFFEELEYPQTEQTWQRLNDVLDARDATTLIVVEQGTVSLLAGPGDDFTPYLTGRKTLGPLMEESMLLPRGDTRILLRRSRGRYFPVDFVRMLSEAEAAGAFAGVDKLLFVSQRSMPSFVTRLRACSGLDRQRLVLDRESSRQNTLDLLEVPRQALIDQLLSPEGSARYCMRMKGRK